jgi:hypothetical protein
VTQNKVKAEIVNVLDNWRFKLANRRQLRTLRTEEPDTDQVVETAAQLLHNVRHRAGYGSTCRECRQYAQIVAWSMEKTPDLERGWMAARDYYGSRDVRQHWHGAECYAARGDAECTCDAAAQRDAFKTWLTKATT